MNISSQYFLSNVKEINSIVFYQLKCGIIYEKFAMRVCVMMNEELIMNCLK